jgi:broad specificity phosphatase PhoE
MATGIGTLSTDCGHNGYVSTRIVLIRHAAVDTTGRLCGSFDVPLNQAGRAHVKSIVEVHRKKPLPHALYTSSLTRALEVGSELGRAWNLEPQVVEWAREIHCGDVEGMPLQQLQRQFPELWACNEAQTDGGFAWPGGETYIQFRARVLAGVRATAMAHKGQRVAVVTHAGVISQVLGVIRRRPACVWAADRPELLTATEVACEDGMPIEVLTYNEADWY